MPYHSKPVSMTALEHAESEVDMDIKMRYTICYKCGTYYPIEGYCPRCLYGSITNSVPNPIDYAFVEGTKILEGHTTSSAPDLINHPPHYTKGGIDTFDFIKAKELTYAEGNVIKYVVRARHKGNHLDDLEKAKWYLEKLIEEAEKK